MADAGRPYRLGVMTRFADPGRCPDCGGPIVSGVAACPNCGLPLRGADAARLFATLAQADQLLVRLREQRVAAVQQSGPVAPPPAASSGPVDPGGPASPVGSASPVGRMGPAGPMGPAFGGGRGGLPAASVPRILLTLGAGCLLVAALVFLAVTWSALGVGGRTAVLAGLTLLAGALAVAMARRRLRGAAEALALVGYGLLVLDLAGANRAGWLGPLGAATFLAVLGGTLIATGAGGALAAERYARRLVAGEVVAAVGTGLVALAAALAQWLPAAPSAVLATGLGLAAAAAFGRGGLPVAAAGSALVALLGWLLLVGEAGDRVLSEGGSWAELWGGLRVWPMLAAAAFAALPALVGVPALVGLPALPGPPAPAGPRGGDGRLPTSFRVGGLAVGLLLLAAAALFPATGLSRTAATAVAIGVLVALVLPAARLPRPWGLVPLPTQAVAAIGVAVVVAGLVGEAVDRLADAADPAFAGAATDQLPAASGDLAPGLLPLGLVALLATVWSVARAAGRRIDRPGPTLVGALALTGAAVALGLSLYPVPLLLVVLALSLLTAGFTGAWLARHNVENLAATATFAALSVAVATAAESLTAIGLGVVTIAAALVARNSRTALTGAAAAAVTAAAAAGEVAAIGALLGVPSPWTALLALLALGILVLGASCAPASWWSDPPDAVRAGLEAGAAVAAVVAAVAGASGSTRPETWVAVYLTVAGVVLTLIALLRPDRRRLAGAGGLLLAAASWVRLADLGVHAPEPYTLPSALALVAAGLVRLRRSPATGTLPALLPGLLLALVPSLLWLLDDVDGRRALALGLGCLALVLAGVRLGWTAPLLTGAAVGAVLVLRLAGPYVGAAVPRWVLIGLAGALLLGLGATWEHRLRDARRVYAYLDRLG